MTVKLNGNSEHVAQLLKTIISLIPDAVMVTDEKGLCVMVNRAYTEISGLSQEDVLGKPANIDIAEKESILMKSLKEKRPILNELRRVGPEKKEVLCSATPIFFDGELVGSVGVMHDISEIKRLSRELEQKNQLLKNLQPTYTIEDIVGKSEAIIKAKERAKACAEFFATVLISGESGTGKELFAHAIHNLSKRSQGPFVRVNCAAINKDLLESELFGYEGGAFTGSLKKGKKGYFEEADGGTIFLDEVSELSMPAQAKLLRVLQEQEVIRVGATVPRKVDVRVIAATNRDLEEEVKAGNFRKDLFYRLDVLSIKIPPLRERKEDIPLLCRHILKKLNQKYGRGVNNISDEALKLLYSYDWPGNVRELENVISRAMINMDISEKEIKKEHIPPINILKEEKNKEEDGVISINIKNKKWKEIKKEFEKKVFDYYLKGKKKKVDIARELGITRRSLYLKIEEKAN
ncbi:sigma-54 interaction domain-containing protein [Thermovenabulum gondwanense]|uniref:Arginine utilization regulatory protein RocR n=1 Tax=Thermovenabulum gondwanense TaxID=520767 RepID=A0A162M3T7_9FIRM|nr:sigma 54-interacting transcriptional regulator [Thermovenabulum gondwanense]KYO63802.1 Arginine utilization regulatory protein RocR [Thermovenabulum gondwanense]